MRNTHKTQSLIIGRSRERANEALEIQQEKNHAIDIGVKDYWQCPFGVGMREAVDFTKQNLTR